MTRFNTRMLLLGALIISALGVSALGAQAKTAPAKPAFTVTGGTVTIKPTAKTVSDLKADKVAQVPVKPATLTKGAITTPIAGGTFNAQLSGTMKLKGKLELVKKGGKTVTLSHFTVTVIKGKTALLFATVKGKTIELAKTANLAIKPASNPKSATATGEAHITKALAELINKLAGNHTAKAGDDLGAITANLKLA